MIIKTKVIEVTDAFKNTKSKLIKNSLKEGKKVFGIKLDSFKGLLGFEINPNRRIGTELADLVKRFGLKGILHSDELPNYGITQEEVNKVKELLGCKENDAFILIIVEDHEKAKFIFRKIVERLNEMIRKVPRDTRQVNKDGTTSFLRPQPGSARMYPETDLPLIYLSKYKEDKGWYEKIKYKVRHGDEEFEINLVRLKEKTVENYFKLKEMNEGFVLDSLDPDFRKEVLKHLGFNEKQIEDILWSENIDFFEKYAKDIRSSLLYYLVFMLPSEVKKEFNIEEKPDIKFLEKIVNYLKENKITKDAVKYIFYYYIKERKGIDEIIREKELYKISGEELRKKVLELWEKYKNLDEKKRKNKILNELRIIADPKEIISIINSEFSSQ